MSSVPSSSLPNQNGGGDHPPLVDALAEDFLNRMRRGQQPSIAEYVQRYPELANEIGDIFPTLAMLERFGADASSTGNSRSAGPVLEQLGDYRIVREIGRGGMGVVYEAEHCTMRRRVALKVLPADLAHHTTLLHRFRREARAVGGLHHTNVVPVFEVGEQQGIHFYAMQFIRGQSLDLVIAELRRILGGEPRAADNKTQRPDQTVEQRAIDSIAESLLSGRVIKPAAPVAEVDSAFELAATMTLTASGREIDRFRHHLLDDAVQSSARRASYYLHVARIGLQVADALAYAHGQGVLHRDIKPANLILDTAGIVWITDFGLAKYDEDGLTRTGDIVGTLRYLPPERLNGQADVRSDVYALGLTLYELCTLRAAFDESDRVRLIKQVTSQDPPAPRSLNRFIPRDLETIILKAIDKQPGSRYPSAEAMADDLRLFTADRPLQSRRSWAVERLWRWCRRNPAMAALGGCVLLLLGVVVWGSLWFGVSSNRQSYELRKQTRLARASEQQSMMAEYQALRAQARAARFSGLRGQRVEGMEAVRKARSLLPRIHDLPQGHTSAAFDLRNDAIASLANPDLRISRSWAVAEPWATEIDFDADYQRYAQPSLAGEVVVRRVVDDQELARLPSPGHRAWVLKFSPDGKYLAVKYHPARRVALQVSVWDLETQQEIICDQGPFRYGRFAFSPDSRKFVIGMRNNVLHVYDLPDGILRTDSPQLEVQPLELAFDPLGQWLAVSDAELFGVECIDLGNGTSHRIQTKLYMHSLAWSHDASLLAGGGEDGNIYLWDPTDLTQPPRIVSGHTAAVVYLVFNHRGDRLASYAWDGSSRLWDLASETPLVRANDVKILSPFSADDRQLGYTTRYGEFGIWEVQDQGPLKPLASPAQQRWYAEYMPDSRSLLLSTTSDGVEVWNTDTSQRIKVLPAGPSTMAHCLPDGSAILSCGNGGILRWPILRSESDWQVGEPEPIVHDKMRAFVVDPTGRWLTCLQDSSITSIDLLSPPYQATKLGDHNQAYQITTSPDGRWVVTSAWQLGSGIKVWNREQGVLIKDLGPDLGSSAAAFSPNGKWLATVVWQHLFVWEVGTWKLLYRLDREANSDWIGPLAFSPDSRLLASPLTRHTIQLIESTTGRRLAVLESSKPGTVAQMKFNTDGSELVVVVDQGLQIWKLDQLQQELAKIGLAWD